MQASYGMTNPMHVVVRRQLPQINFWHSRKLYLVILLGTSFEGRCAEMEVQWCIIFYALSWVQIYALKVHTFTPEFLRILKSLNGTDGLALQRKIIFEIGQAQGRQNSLWRNSYSLNEDLHQCHTDLLNIFADDLWCPNLAKQLKPFLDIEEYFYSMKTEQKLYQSYIERNCSTLSGKSARTCELLTTSGSWTVISFEIITSLIEQCRLQYNDRERESTDGLSPRYPEKAFLIHVFE